LLIGKQAVNFFFPSGLGVNSQPKFRINPAGSNASFFNLLFRPYLPNLVCYFFFFDNLCDFNVGITIR
jgi:hypothetical protein